MAKHTSPMRLNDNLVSEAQVMAAVMHRSAAEQIEYWSEIGKRLSATLTPQQTVDFMRGQATITIDSPSHTGVNPLALANKVAESSATGELSQSLLKQGQTLYEPASEGGGVLIATMPDGTVQKGKFSNGKFKPLRKKA